MEVKYTNFSKIAHHTKYSYMAQNINAIKISLAKHIFDKAYLTKYKEETTHMLTYW
jgi:hypothetical protein